MNKCVIKEWVHELPLQMQSALLSGLRGPDGVSSQSEAKVLVRAMRSVLSHNALPKGGSSYIVDGVGCTPEELKQFLKVVDQYPYHWFAHFYQSAEIIGYYHPDKEVREFWLDVYHQCCAELFTNPETKEQLAGRLKANG
ncbi:MAG: hypothetical protein AAGA35_04110 [Patescibacteria group bacterium]